MLASLPCAARQATCACEKSFCDHEALLARVDGNLKEAVYPDPHKRYEVPFEFVNDLRHPTPISSVPRQRR